MAKILSIQVGEPTIRGRDSISKQDWESGIFKLPVTGAVWMGPLNLLGDGQADLDNHGGPDKAVLAYAACHYPVWRELYPKIEWTYGGFGENFTVDGLTEEDVCIGDVYAVGETLVQVSQPRKPCWKLARRWQLKELSAKVDEIGYTGWYLRVMRQGEVEAGMEMTLLERPYPQWTVRRASDILNHHKNDAALNLELAACPALADVWKRILTARATSVQT